MKVLQILSNLNVGGPQLGALEMAKALVQAGHESLVVSSGGSLVKRLERDKSTHIELAVDQKNLKALVLIKPLRDVIRTHKPDIIHVRARMPAWITYFALKGIAEHKRPIVVSTVHTLYPPTHYSKIMTKASRVICISDHALNYMTQNFPDTPSDKLVRIYRGIDSKHFPYRYQPSVHWWTNTLAEFPELRNKIWLTLPGEITENTNHQWMLDVVGGLKEDYPNIHALFIGAAKDKSADYFDELQLRIHALGLEPYVTFTGARDDKRDWLAASNIVFELSGQPKTFSRNLLESLFLGTPVIAWNHGGMPEILNRLYPEGLTPKDDCLALCRLVRKHLDNKLTPKRPNEFFLKPMTDQGMALYLSLLEQKQTQPSAQTKPAQKMAPASTLQSTDVKQGNKNTNDMGISEPADDKEILAGTVKTQQ